jgi:hypothetical protein
MAKILRDYEYSNENMGDVAREELVKALVHGVEVQNGSHRRRTHSINEYLKAIGALDEAAAVESGNGIVRQAVFLRGRRG